MEEGKKKDVAKDICYVCHKNKINFRVEPCRHAYLCKKCSMKMMSGKCKICHEFYDGGSTILPGEPLNLYSDEEEDKEDDSKDK